MFKNSLKISKISYFLSLIVIITINSKAIAVEDLSFPFNSDSGKYWQYISDQVMGGVSVGKVTLEQDGEMYYARLTGNVSTRNYGGVIQLRTGISFANSEKDGKNLQGVRLNVRGNGETYDIHIITNDMAYYGDFYSATFQADSDWKMIDLPFNTFERKRSNNTKLDAQNITRLGIVAYGREYVADISVSTIEFYY
jgi:hypothetical protein